MDDLIRPDEEHILSVSDLTRHIKRQLEGDFSRIWVRGEVSNLRRQQSGHLYFSLKDAGSQLPCVLFSRDAARQSFTPADGMELLLMGDLSVYEPHGRYQLIGKIAIRAGEGRLQLEFERLKRKLAAEGLFEAARKRPLPLFPSHIAVVTSPSGAALRDFLRVLRRRGFRGRISLLPAAVQGKAAPGELLERLETAGQLSSVDCIVLTRGGGSIEDLWAFNDETLARAVAAAPKPVLSAVGHQIDTVLTDYAADLRAETPTGAAEHLTSRQIETIRTAEAFAASLVAETRKALEAACRSLESSAQRLKAIAPERRIAYLGMRLDELDYTLERHLSRRIAREQSKMARLERLWASHHPQHQLQLAQQSLHFAAQRLGKLATLDLNTRSTQLANIRKRLQNSSLQSALRRGFAILRTSNGTILSSREAALKQARVEAELKDGKLTLRPEDRT